VKQFHDKVTEVLSEYLLGASKIRNMYETEITALKPKKIVAERGLKMV
jgi:hypothetical protein